MTLLDTNILIEVLKGNSSIVDKLEPDQQYAISVVCVMELIFGARGKAEVKKIERALSQLQCYHITSSISKSALELMRKYTKSHGLGIPDALIAATAMKDRISESLKPLHPEKVILFGSYARGLTPEDSDIDLIVVLNKEQIPKTYRDKMANRLLVRRALDELNRDYALDLLVYTSSEWRDFQELGSAFSMEIASRGIEV